MAVVKAKTKAKVKKAKPLADIKNMGINIPWNPQTEWKTIKDKLKTYPLKTISAIEKGIVNIDNPNGKNTIKYPKFVVIRLKKISHTLASGFNVTQ